MWLTNTFDVIPTNNNPLLVNHKEEGLIFLNEEIQTSKNISHGQIYQEISIEAPSITYIVADHFHEHRFGQDSTVVLSFQQSLCNGTVCIMCVWMHQLREELLKCQVFLYDDSSGNGIKPMQSK